MAPLDRKFGLVGSSRKTVRSRIFTVRDRPCRYAYIIFCNGYARSTVYFHQNIYILNIYKKKQINSMFSNLILTLCTWYHVLLSPFQNVIPLAMNLDARSSRLIAKNAYIWDGGSTKYHAFPSWILRVLSSVEMILSVDLWILLSVDMVHIG